MSNPTTFQAILPMETTTEEVVTTSTSDVTTVIDVTTTANATGNTNQIIGGVVGTAAVLIIIAVIIYIKCRCCRKKKDIAPPPSKDDVENPHNIFGRNRYSKEPNRFNHKTSSSDGAYADAKMPDNTAVIQKISSTIRMKEERQKKRYVKKDVEELNETGQPFRMFSTSSPPAEPQDDYLSPSEARECLGPVTASPYLRIAPEINDTQEVYQNTAFRDGQDIYQNTDFHENTIFPKAFSKAYPAESRADATVEQADVYAPADPADYSEDDIYQNQEFAQDQFGSTASVDSFYMSMSRDGATSNANTITPGGLFSNNEEPPVHHGSNDMEPIYGNQ